MQASGGLLQLCRCVIERALASFEALDRWCVEQAIRAYCHTRFTRSGHSHPPPKAAGYPSSSSCVHTYIHTHVNGPQFPVSNNSTTVFRTHCSDLVKCFNPLRCVAVDDTRLSLSFSTSNVSSPTANSTDPTHRRAHHSTPWRAHARTTSPLARLVRACARTKHA